MVKAYLRYEEGDAFGVVSAGQARVCYDKSGKLLLVGALEKCLVWNVKQGRCVSALTAPAPSSGGVRPQVTALAPSPSSSTLVAAGYKDGAILVWDMVKGTCETVLKGHKGAITALAYNKSGALLASGSTDTNIIVWDAVGEAGLYSLRAHRDQVTDLLFLENCKKLVSSSKDTNVRVWDLDTQSCVQRVVSNRSAVWSLDVDPLERHLVIGSADPELRVYGIAPNEKEEHVVPETEKGLVTAAGPNGQVVQKDSGRDLAETNWDILLPLGTIKRQSADRVATVKFNSSGTLLGCQVAGKTVEVYRIRDESEMLKKAKRRKKRKRKKTSTTGEDMEGEENIDGDDHEDDAKEILASDMFELSQVVRLKQKLGSFSFSPLQPKKGVIATIALALQNNSLEVYELQEQTSSRIHSIDLPGHRSDVRVTVLSADSTTLMTASHNAVKIWNPRSGTCLRTIESGYGLCGIIVPGNRQAILGTKAGTLEIFDIAAAELIQVVDAHGGAIWSLAPMPDGSGFVSGGADHDVKFWEYQLVQSTDKSSKHLSVRNTRLLRMTDDVLCVRTSPDAKYIAVALLDSTIKVFFSDSLKFFVSLYGHKLPVLTMDISSDGALLASGSADKNLKIWGMDFGDCHRSLFAHGDSVMAVQFVPKTHYIFSAGKDGVLKYWDADKFELLLTLEGHHAEVWCLAVSPHGDFVVTGSHDRSIRRWDRTEEPFFIEEETEKRLESMFEAVQDDSKDESLQQTTEVGAKRTQESLTAADSIIEALDMAEEEIERMRLHKTESGNGKLVNFQPNVMMLQLSPSAYVLRTMVAVRPSDLEQALVTLPFTDALKLLGYLRDWISAGDQVELVCRVATLLLRIHHQQLTATAAARPVLTSLHSVLHGGIQKMKDTLGFNLAAMGHIQGADEVSGEVVVDKSLSYILLLMVPEQHLLTKRSDAASKAVGMKLLDIRAKIAKKREENKPKPRKRQKKIELSRTI